MIQLNRVKIIQVLNKKNDLGIKLLFVFLMVYIFNTAPDHRMIKLPVLIISLFLVVFNSNRKNQLFLWYLFLIVLVVDLITGYFLRANHHFLLIYVTVLVILYLKNEKTEEFRINIKFLIVIVLLLSAIQKLLSPQFISGDFYYYMFNLGGFFKLFLRFNHEMGDIVAINNAQILSLRETDPNALNTITFKNIVPNLHVISYMFAWLTIILEFIAAIFLLWKPQHKFSHLLFVFLIVGIFLARLENGFLTLLAISGLWLTENIKFKVIYISLAILFMSLIIVRIGFY